MNRTYVALGVTAFVLVPLIIIGGAQQAVTPAIHGPDEVSTEDAATFHATVETNADVTVERLELDVRDPTTDEFVTVTFTPGGTAVVTEADGDLVGERTIDMAALAASVQIDPLGPHSMVGYGTGYGTGYGAGYGSGYGTGYGSGYGPAAGTGYGSAAGTGYGAGAGYGPGNGTGYGYAADGESGPLAFAITFDGRVLAPNRSYELEFRVVTTDGETFVSNVREFAVIDDGADG